VTITKNNHILDEKIKGFIQALTDSPEYQSFQKAQEEFNADEKATKLFSDFQNAQQTYSVFRQGGFPGVEDQKNKLGQLQRRMQQNKKINNLLISQRDLQILIADIVNDISQAINFPLVPPQSSGGCC